MTPNLSLKSNLNAIGIAIENQSLIVYRSLLGEYRRRVVFIRQPFFLAS
jgi:hypothetical protein